MSEEAVGVELETAMDAPFEIEGEESAASVEDGHMLTESELHDLLAQSAEPEAAPVEEDLSAGFSGAGPQPQAESPAEAPVPEKPAAHPAHDSSVVISSAVGAADLLTVEQATRALAVPLEMRGESLVVLTAAPVDEEEIERLKKELECEIEVQEGPISDVVKMLRQTYGSEQDELARRELVGSGGAKRRSRVMHWLKGLAS